MRAATFGSSEREPVMNEMRKSELEDALAEGSGQSLIGEFWDFLKHNKKWWLLPIVIVLMGFGLLILLSGSAAAPFIYTLF